MRSEIQPTKDDNMQSKISEFQYTASMLNESQLNKSEIQPTQVDIIQSDFRQDAIL